MSAIYIFETKGAENDENVNFLKGGPMIWLSVMGGPMDMIFDMFSETYVRLLKSITSQFFSKYSERYNNLNVSTCLKLHGS